MTENNSRELWYDKSVEQLEKRFATDRGKGLSKSDVIKARREHGKNHVYKTPNTLSIKQIIPTDISAIILLATLAMAAIFDLKVEAGIIAGMVVLNYAISLFTYFKARSVLDGMTEYSLPTAKVLRDGKPSLIDMRSLVPGDVIFLAAGDIVPADCRLFMSDGLAINEGTLTGIHSSVKKDGNFANFAPSLPIEERKNMAYATTIVTAGHGRGIVVDTGKNTEAVIRDKTQSITTHEDLKILTLLKKYCSVWSMSMLALVFAITLIGLIFRSEQGVFEIFLSGIALAAAAMSELYMAFGYIIVGCGIFSAMKRRKDVNVGALIKNAKKLEKLKELSVLIVPKEGVITSANSYIEKIYTGGKLYSANDIDRVDKLRATVLAGVISTGIYGAGLASLTETSRKITSEEEAIIKLAESLSLYNANIDRSHPIIEHAPAGGASKFETTLTVDSDRHYMAVCRGDAEAVLKSCEYYTQNGGIYRMTSDDRIALAGVASGLTKSSYHVVAVATGVTGYNNLARIGSIQSDLTFEGFLVLREPLQPNIAQTVARCRDAGIHVIMTCDNYTESDKYLALSMGLLKSEKGILTGFMADSLSDNMLRTNLPLYNMYVGVSPAKISQILRMMSADGKKVGILTGGMSGALLMKRADVGLAKSVTISPKAKRAGIDLRSRQNTAYANIAGGSSFDCEALKFISDVVISDADDKGNGGFGAIVSALEYSRTIYRNILRMVRYLTTTQLARIFVILGGLILGIKVLTPIQIVFGGLALDLLAIIASAFSRPPHHTLSMKENAEESLKKPWFIGIKSLIFALLQAITVLAVHPILTLIGHAPSAAEFAAAAFVTFSVCQYITFISLSSERSIFLSGGRISISYMLFSGGLILFLASLFVIPPFGKIFDVCALPLPLIIAVCVVSALIFAVNEIYKIITKTNK